MISNVTLMGSFILYENNGEYFAPSIYDDNFFLRYTSVFGKINLVAKIKRNENIQGMNLIDTKKLNIIEIDYFQGIRGLIFNYFSTRKRIHKCLNSSNIHIYRIAQIESMLGYLLTRNNKVFRVVEVVNDPEYFELGFMTKKILMHVFRKMVVKSDARSFVTKNTLQSKYDDGNPNVIRSYYSSVELEAEYFKTKNYRQEYKGDFRIIHVSNNIQDNSKGTLTVLKILKTLKNQGKNVKLTIIGDGPYVKRLKEYVKQNGLLSSVEFTGKISNKYTILELIHSHDIMVLPTKFEGLPRTLLEAMSVGVPCISSNIGGIPEILDEEYIFEPTDILGFSKKIVNLMNSKDILQEQSDKNLKMIQNFCKSNLDMKRSKFYTEIYRKTRQIEEKV